MLKVQELREIIQLIDNSSINEFTYETNGTTVIIKKPKDDLVDQVVKKPLKEAQIAETPKEKVTVTKQVITEEEQPTPVEEESSEENQVDFDDEIVSPMVGTFYQAPSPESEPYVKVGDQVNNETIVCIVEAMKLFNEIEAEISGEIVEVLVNDGELVEYGQPLFRVKNT